jgi:hypothetical protein
MYPTSRHTAAVAAAVGLTLLLALYAAGIPGGHRQFQFALPPGVRMRAAPMAAPRSAVGPSPMPSMLEDRASSASAEGRLMDARGIDLAPAAAIGSTVDVSRMMVRTGEASLEVASLDSTVPRVRALATGLGGFVANSSLQAGREQVRTATLEVKAPAPEFEHLVAGLGTLGKVESVNVSAQDVGEEYVDVEARIANAHRLEARLVELLATRTGRLKDVLDVEQQLARVREDIERYEGRMRYLRVHTELSTLTITIHEPEPIIDHVGSSPIANAARQAWRNFIALVAFVIASLGVVLPVAAVGGVVWVIVAGVKRSRGEIKPG